MKEKKTIKFVDPKLDPHVPAPTRFSGGIIGYVEEIWGPGGQLCEGFQPTRHELRVLYTYWASWELEIHLEWFLGYAVGSFDICMRPYASMRLATIKEALGKAECKELDKRAEADVRHSKGEENWRMFIEGVRHSIGEENWRMFIEKKNAVEDRDWHLMLQESWLARSRKETMNELCPSCSAQPGELHERSCDVESCPYCGNQAISCCCEVQANFEDIPDDDRMPWTGEWPGVAECRDFGWYAKQNPNGPGWLHCQPDDSGAVHDLNRLRTDAVWDRKKKRWVRK